MALFPEETVGTLRVADHTGWVHRSEELIRSHAEAGRGAERKATTLGHRFLRDQMEEHQVSSKWVATEEQPVDALLKGEPKALASLR